MALTFTDVNVGASANDGTGDPARTAFQTVNANFDTIETDVLLADGSNALTANWDAGSFKITAETLASDVATGTAPLTVASTTLVSNLNADLLDGVEASAFLQDVVSDTTPQLGGALDGQGNDLNNLGVVFLTEQAAAEADVAGKGQFWTKTATPNRAMFTDDAGSDFELLRETLVVAVSDETSDLTTGTAKVTFRMPYAMNLAEVRASVTTAPTGSTIIVDINESGTTVLSTKITIDASEKTSETAATAPVISDSALADDAEMTIDLDQIGSGTAGAGLKIYLIGYRA
jgi:hypothetical protein